MYTVNIDTNSTLGRALTAAADVCNLDPADLAAGMLYAAVKTKEAKEAAASDASTSTQPPAAKQC